MKPLYDNFIDHLASGHELCRVYLVNGVRLDGTISRKDKDGVTIVRDGKTQLVMRTAIATVEPVSFFLMDDIERS